MKLLVDLVPAFAVSGEEIRRSSVASDLGFVSFDRVLSSIFLLFLLAASICVELLFSYRKEKQLVKYMNECRPKIRVKDYLCVFEAVATNTVKGESETSTMQPCLLFV